MVLDRTDEGAARKGRPFARPASFASSAIARWLTGAGVAAALACSQAAPAAAAPVAGQGLTRITASSSPSVHATIVTRRASAEETVAPRATRCSGGRVPCSLVDRLTLEVGGAAVEVPPRAVLLLADVNDAQLRRVGGDRYELVLTCGDAAPAYEARLFFTPRRVTRLDIWSDEANMIEQRTTFDDVSKAFR